MTEEQLQLKTLFEGVKRFMHDHNIVLQDLESEDEDVQEVIKSWTIFCSETYKNAQEHIEWLEGE